MSTEIALLQFRMVSAIFSQMAAKEVALKGGMAMRVHGGEVRNTRDIDLSASPTHPSVSALRGRIRNAIASFKRISPEYASFVVSEPKMTDTTMRWKINGTLGGEAVFFKIEVSRRSHLPKEHIQRKIWKPEFANGVVAVDIFDEPAMIASKVAALASDQRNAPRDVFDIWIMGKLSFQMTDDLRSLLLEKNPDILKTAWDKIDGMSFEQAKSELVPFLSKDLASRFDEGFWDEIKLGASTAIESWIATNSASNRPRSP